MKKIKPQAFFFLLFFVLSLLSCEQNRDIVEPKQTVSIDTLMPAYTDTGANTLAYKVRCV